MPHSLFIISTASQAFFLAHSPQLVPDDSFLILTVKDKKQTSDILDQIKHLAWKRIYIWDSPQDSSRSSLFRRLVLIRVKMLLFKLRYPSFEKVYIGSYNNLIHLSILRDFDMKKNIFLLYDGLQLVTVHDLRRATNQTNVRQLPKVYRTLGFKVPQIASLNYISPLPLKIDDSDSILVIKNKLSYKKKEYNKSLIYFIGQPLPLIGAVDRQFYLDSVKDVFSKYEGSTFVYFSHPKEDEETINGIKAFMSVKNLDTIFEEYFLQSTVFAGKIFSFYSSVLVNLIFLRAQSQIFAIDIPEEKILPDSYKPIIRSVYKYFRSNSDDNFKVISSN